MSGLGLVLWEAETALQVRDAKFFGNGMQRSFSLYQAGHSVNGGSGNRGSTGKEIQ